MINSLLDVADEKLFPMTIDDQSITAQLKQVFPELTAYFGKDYTLKLVLNAKATDGAKWLSISKDSGFKIGGDNIDFSFDLICSNATAQDKLAATIAMKLDINTQTNIFAFNVFPMIGDVAVRGAYVKTDNIGMYAHDYNRLFTSVLKNAAVDMNTQFNENGWPLANIDPTIGMLAGLLQEFTVSPSKADGFVMLGWSMYADMPTLVADYRNEDVSLKAPVEGVTIIDFAAERQ